MSITSSIGIGFCVLLLCAGASGVEVHKGTIGDSLYQIAEPDKWNGKLVMLAHGYRPTEEPLRAAFPISEHFHQTLLSRGWMIASTSYRRNGFLLDDAIEDLYQLLDQVEKQFDKPRQVTISGNSMGGGIVTRIAESDQTRVHGVIALGAFLSFNDSSYAANIPILFVSNRSELDGPRDYVAKSTKGKVKPVLWTIDRDGHVNLNDEEWLIGFDALQAFIAGTRPEPNRDITVVSTLESRATFTEAGAVTRIQSINESFGNINTELNQTDIDRLKLSEGDYLVCVHGPNTAKVYFGTTYSDVKRGDWVAFMTAEGNLRLARNFENAAETLKVKVGDLVLIGKL